MEPDLALATTDPVDGHNRRRGVRKALLGSAIALSTLGLAAPAWGAGVVPPRRRSSTSPRPPQIPINNPCTGDPGITTTNDFVTITTWTYPDGSKNINIQDKGTFVFVPARPDEADLLRHRADRDHPGPVGSRRRRHVQDRGQLYRERHRRFTRDGPFDHRGHTVYGCPLRLHRHQVRGSPEPARRPGASRRQLHDGASPSVPAPPRTGRELRAP